MFVKKIFIGDKSDFESARIALRTKSAAKVRTNFDTAKKIPHNCSFFPLNLEPSNVLVKVNVMVVVIILIMCICHLCTYAQHHVILSRCKSRKNNGGWGLFSYQKREKSYQFKHFQGVSVFSKTRKIGDFIEKKQQILPIFSQKRVIKSRRKQGVFLTLIH